MKLGETQRWFAGAVMNGADLKETDRLLTPGPRLGPTERLHVYQHGYVARLVECLADDYPVLKHLLGEEPFDSLCRRYVERHPSRAPNLNAYGRHMADLCVGFAADLARLEWAIVEVIHEPALPPLTMETLATVPMGAWGTARLVAAKAVRLLSLAYPANDYFQAVRDEESPDAPAARATATVVHRSGRTVWRMGLTPPMQRVLGALLAGKPLEGALDLAGDVPAEHVTAWFREWVGERPVRGHRSGIGRLLEVLAFAEEQALVRAVCLHARRHAVATRRAHAGERVAAVAQGRAERDAAARLDDGRAARGQLVGASVGRVGQLGQDGARAHEGLVAAQVEAVGIAALTWRERVDAGDRPLRGVRLEGCLEVLAPLGRQIAAAAFLRREAGRGTGCGRTDEVVARGDGARWGWRRGRRRSAGDRRRRGGWWRWRGEEDVLLGGLEPRRRRRPRAWPRG